MSFDRDGLIQTCKRHRLVTRVVVASVRGSAPREVGASMLVWEDGISGTIGGGTLEHKAIQTARAQSAPGSGQLTRHALGPDMGQCCGGAVELWTQCFDLKSAKNLSDDVVVQGDGETPLAVQRLKARVRNSGVLPSPQCIDGWMVEPVSKPDRHIWIWGAGHVGRALASVLSPLPQIKITWIDTCAERFPDATPLGIEQLIAQDPAMLAPYAPACAEHLIVTYSHALDLELCHRLLHQEFRFVGLIGSKTKWARFQSRLRDLQHSNASIGRITCPIGQPDLGKHPQMIALGVANEMLKPTPASTLRENLA